MAGNGRHLKPELKVLLSHPGTGPFVQHAARALFEASLLQAYVTTFAYQPASRLGKFLSKVFKLFYADPERQLARRQISEIPEELVITHPLPELVRMLTVKSGLGPVIADLVWEHTELWFDRMVARSHLAGSTAVYGYEHAALETFRVQKQRGGWCIYEQPIAHHATTSAILDAEFAWHPEAETARDRHLRKLAPRRNARKDRELELADLIIVNSKFTKHSLVAAGAKEDRIRVVPLGAPPVVWKPRPAQPSPFIFLCAGTQSVRKGVHYLLEAWRRLAPSKDSDVELWLVGAMMLPASLFEDLPGKVMILTGVPKEELFTIYRKASVLVFPSLAEGFGMVITEAMSQGLPVITTNHTVGPDLIENGHSGFLVPVRDVEALAQSMQWCLENRWHVVEIGREAARAAERWQWADYRRALGAVVSEFLRNPQGAREDEIQSGGLSERLVETPV